MKKLLLVGFLIFAIFCNFTKAQTKNVLNNEVWLFRQSVGGNLEISQSYYFYATGKFVRLDRIYHHGNSLTTNFGDYFYNPETNTVFLKYMGNKRLSKNGEMPKPINLKGKKEAIKIVESADAISIIFYNNWDKKKDKYFPLLPLDSVIYNAKNIQQSSDIIFETDLPILFVKSFQRKNIDKLYF